MNFKTSIVTSAADGCGKPSSIRTMDNSHRSIMARKESFMFFNRRSISRSCSFAAAALAAMVAVGLAGTASASVIYSDNFPGSSTAALDGTSPATDATAATWSAPLALSSGGWAANGSTTNTSTNADALLSFTPVSGNVYTLSATLDPTGLNSNWIALGFADANSSTPMYTSGGPWTIVRGNGQIAFSPGPGATSVGGYTSTTSPETSSLVLNTEGSQWTFQGYYNGKLEITDTYAVGSNPTNIAYVGIDTNGEPGSVSNFQLTAVPEPTTLGLSAVGGLGLLLIGRRRAARRNG